MNNLLTGLAAALALLATQSVAADQPRVEKFSSELHDIKQLSLAFNHGQVSITTTAGKPERVTVELEQRLKRGDPGRCLYKLNETRSGGRLAIAAEPEVTSGRKSCSVDRHYRVQLDPATLRALTLEHHHARLNLDEVTVPEFSLQANHSQVEVGAVTGERAAVDLGHSDARITALRAPRLDINGGHSRLALGELTGKAAKGQWQHGKFKVEQSQVDDLQLEFAHSNVEFAAHRGAVLRADSAHGPLHIAGDLTRSAELRNAHGKLDYEGAVPRLTVSNVHGRSQLIQTLASAPFEIEGEGSHGSIDVVVPKGVEYDYQVNSNRGRSATGRAGRGADSNVSRVSLNVTHGNADIKAR